MRLGAEGSSWKISDGTTNAATGLMSSRTRHANVSTRPECVSHLHDFTRIAAPPVSSVKIFPRCGPRETHNGADAAKGRAHLRVHLVARDRAEVAPRFRHREPDRLDTSVLPGMARRVRRVARAIANRGEGSSEGLVEAQPPSVSLRSAPAAAPITATKRKPRRTFGGTFKAKRVARKPPLLVPAARSRPGRIRTCPA